MGEYEELKKQKAEILAREEQRKWQPIKTVPKGEVLLLAVKGGKIPVIFRYDDELIEVINGRIEFTHWMPLPQLPEHERNKS